MKITKVCCQGCGADLEVDESVRYVTCNYCHTRLEVVHDQTVTHTRLLDRIERTTSRMADNLKVIELQNDIERLDREWDNRRQGLMVPGKNGHVSEPHSPGALVAGVFPIAAGVLWIVFTSSMPGPSFFPLFGLLIIGFAIFNLVSTTNKASAYKEGQTRYEAERERLLQLLENERRR